MSKKLMEGEGAMERRIRIVGLCLVAVLALCAVFAASGAQAAEFGQCVKTVKIGKVYKGHFNNRECTEEASPETIGKGGKTNKYNWEAGPGHNSTYSIKGGASTISSSVGTVNCKKISGGGRIRGAKTAEAKINFSGCKLESNSKPCKTKGAEVGTGGGVIESLTLIAFLHEHAEPLEQHEGPGAEEPKEGEQWVTFTHKAEANPNFVVFECEGQETVTVTSWVSAQFTGAVNKMGKKSGVLFTLLSGEQNLLSEFFNNITSETEKEIETTLTTAEPLQLKFESSYEMREL